MKTNNTATAIKRLALATTLVLVITISISARAAETFQGAMNHGLAYFQAQDFANANAWFSYARRMRPNDRGAIFWTSNSAGYQFAKSGQWAHSADCWKRCVALYPATAGQLNPKITYANRVAQNQFQADFDDFVNDAGNVVKLMVAIAPLFGL
ncbi:MAG: hypothetical protein WCT04_20605 [Planctomycetota bacterium]